MRNGAVACVLLGSQWGRPPIWFSIGNLRLKHFSVGDPLGLSKVFTSFYLVEADSKHASNCFYSLAHFPRTVERLDSRPQSPSWEVGRRGCWAMDPVGSQWSGALPMCFGSRANLRKEFLHCPTVNQHVLEILHDAGRRHDHPLLPKKYLWDYVYNYVVHGNGSAWLLQYLSSWEAACQERQCQN